MNYTALSYEGQSDIVAVRLAVHNISSNTNSLERILLRRWLYHSIAEYQLTEPADIALA